MGILLDEYLIGFIEVERAVLFEALQFDLVDRIGPAPYLV